MATNPLLAGYELSNNSPCVATGTNTVGALNDYNGTAFTDPPNMGAYSGVMAAMNLTNGTAITAKPS